MAFPQARGGRAAKSSPASVNASTTPNIRGTSAKAVQRLVRLSGFRSALVAVRLGTRADRDRLAGTANRGANANEIPASPITMNSHTACSDPSTSRNEPPGWTVNHRQMDGESRRNHTSQNSKLTLPIASRWSYRIVNIPRAQAIAATLHAHTSVNAAASGTLKVPGAIGNSKAGPATTSTITSETYANPPMTMAGVMAPSHEARATTRDCTGSARMTRRRLSAIIEVTPANPPKNNQQ